jgi:hypothetical protein
MKGDRTQSELSDLNKQELRRFEVYKIYNKKKDKKKPFITNVIHTAKYNVLTFLPKNLFYQFSKLSNTYFLLITFLDWNINKKVPTMVFPLSFVIFISMLKDIFEDLKRHASDKKENTKRVLVGNYAKGTFEE